MDIDERTYNMDPEKLREYLEMQCYFDDGKLKNRKTGLTVTAVVPVHLYGQTADMDPILELAERYNLIVIEDACQAHGAEYFSRKENRWRKAGSMGLAAAFSFYPGKNLGACGEAGAVTTNDAEMARKMRMLRDHGQSKKYYHDVEGYNGRLDAIQAGFLSVKLRRLRNGMKNGGNAPHDIRNCSIRRQKGSTFPTNRPGRKRFTTSSWCGLKTAFNFRSISVKRRSARRFTIPFLSIFKRPTPA